MKIHGTAKGGALSTKDFGVAFGGAAAETIIYSQTDASSNMYNYESINVAGGLKVGSGASLIGEEINKVTFSLNKTGTPPQATLYARVFNTGSGITVKHEFGSLATSELTDTAEAYSFDDNLGSAYTIIANDVISIYCDNSATSYPDDMVLIKGKSGSALPLIFADYNGSAWATGGRLPYLILAKVG